jgi:hypothetical protein
MISCAPSSAAIVPLRECQASSHTRIAARPHAADVAPALDEALFVEQAVRRQEDLPVHVADERHRLAERDVERAVVQLVPPDLVEPDADVDRRPRAVNAMQVGGETTSRDRVLANAPLEEVPAERRLGEAHEAGARLERGGLRQQLPDPGEIAGVVALPWLELGERERDEGGHERKLTWEWACGNSDCPKTAWWGVEGGGW